MLPVQRGNVPIDNLMFLNAIRYVAVNGCTWRGLPKKCGRWHSAWIRMRWWAENGVLDRVFKELQVLNILKDKIEVVRMGSTNITVLLCGTGALNKGGRKPSGEAGMVDDFHDALDEHFERC